MISLRWLARVKHVETDAGKKDEVADGERTAESHGGEDERAELSTALRKLSNALKARVSWFRAVATPPRPLSVRSTKIHVPHRLLGSAHL